MDPLTHHPVYNRLITPADPFVRHAFLHDMELQLARLQRCPGLQARVRHFRSEERRGERVWNCV